MKKLFLTLLKFYQAQLADSCIKSGLFASFSIFFETFTLQIAF